MSQLTKKQKTMVPSLTSDLLNTESVLFPSIFDFGGGLLDNTASALLPDANIIENQKDFKIELAAPGLEKKDFTVETKNGILSISAEKEDTKNFKRREFSYNSFNRSFTLPENCVPDKIVAKYENGILNLTLPKKEASTIKPAKQIKVA
ncbi:MAG: Hsp20/alpha crystallin family protein [Bacteroidota bacterium]|nr:Hsp20/alpha crystallin family protein [Bacteroidota bacterium]